MGDGKEINAKEHTFVLTTHSQLIFTLDNILLDSNIGTENELEAMPSSPMN